MSKVIVHNPLANQHIDHSHMSNSGNIDEEATKRLRQSLDNSFNNFYNSPGFRNMRELEQNRSKGGHPTDFDKNY